MRRNGAFFQCIGILCFMLLVIRCSFAQGEQLEARKLFYQGNSAYKEAKYDAAIQNYEKSAACGWQASNLYYNLGNSYFKKGELGKALQHYEKARMLSPNDGDLRSNYEYVLSLLDLKDERFGNGFQKLADRLFENVTVDLLALFLSCIYMAVLALLTCNLYFPGLKKPSRFIFSVLALAFIICAVSLNDRINYMNKGAICLVKNAPARFEPLLSATTYFKLAEGLKVEIIDESDDWYKIKRPDGKIGWVDKAALGRIS